MQLTKRPQAMLFDLDGTLAHTLPQLSVAACKVARQMNLPEPTAEQMANYVGNGVVMLLCRVIMGRHEVSVDQVPDDKLKIARELFNRYYSEGLSQDFEVYPYVQEGLALFKDMGIALGVVTNKPHVFAEPLLGYMGLTPYFGAILGGEVLDKKKPDPTPLFYVLDKLHVPAEKAIMVGDSLNDVKAGENAHMPTVAFTYGYNGGYDLHKDCHPDYLFDSFKQLIDLILGLPDR